MDITSYQQNLNRLTNSKALVLSLCIAKVWLILLYTHTRAYINTHTQQPISHV